MCTPFTSQVAVASFCHQSGAFTLPILLGGQGLILGFPLTAHLPDPSLPKVLEVPSLLRRVLFVSPRLPKRSRFHSTFLPSVMASRAIAMRPKFMLLCTILNPSGSDFPPSPA